MLVCVESTDLHEATILAQTHTKHFFRDYASIKHRFVNGLLAWDTHAAAHAQPQNSISGLIVKELGLLGDASEWKFKAVLRGITEEYPVSDHEPFVTRPLHVALVKLTFVPICARTTSVCLTIVDVSWLAVIESVPLVDVGSTWVSRALSLAVILARHCCHRWTCVHNQRLSLLVGSKVNIGVKILQVRRVSIQLRRLHVQM